MHSPKLPTDQGADLPADWSVGGGAVQLLYLFGKARPSPLFAIHDEDLLEYAHNVIAGGSHAPKAFPRRAARPQPAAGGLQLSGLAQPLHACAPRARGGWPTSRAGAGGWSSRWAAKTRSSDSWAGTALPPRCLPIREPAQFVDELHRRWMAEHQPGVDDAPKVAERAMPESAMFFISYSRTTDLARALRLYEALKGLGVAENEIWFDRETLEPADLFKQRILDGVRSCRYFLPLVSRAATEREQAFVFREWSEATRMLPELNRTYLVPLVVDPESVPETYRQSSVRPGSSKGSTSDTRLKAHRMPRRPSS